MDLSLHRGDARTYTMTVTAGGAPLDLTGKTIRFVARRDVGSPAIFTKLTGDGIVHDPDQTANRGECTVTLAPADTSGLPNSRVLLLWEMEVTAAGNPQTFLTGRLEVRPELVTA